jgi:microcystin-dependent protein
VGSGHTLGERGGEQAHTLSIAESPQHTHVANATNTPQDSLIPTGRILANSAPSEFYVGTVNTSMNPATLSNIGGSQAHLNMQPFLTLNFSIALQGIFPSPN